MSGPFAASQSTRYASVTSPEPDVESVVSQRRVRLDVPISHPRYEFKTRLNRAIAVTDSASEDTGRSPSMLLSMRSTESLQVRHGPVSHQEEITYRAFACFKHGARRVHTQSVGYSSDGDLVLMRRDVSEASDSGPNASLRRAALAVDAAVCLNPQARPTAATLSEDADSAVWARRLARMKKYPGVKCPKNRKVRNRLMNDHFATAAARALYNAADTDDDPDGLKAPAQPTFEAVPKSLDWLVHTDEQLQQDRMEKLGLDIGRFGAVGGIVKPAVKQPPKSIDSAAFRFTQLQARMKSELQHAMATEYMPRFIDELEGRIEALIADDADATKTDAPTSIEVECRDGYGRLITHGVAAFYKLVSQSSDVDGRRLTIVSLPKKRVPLPEQRLAAYLNRGNGSRSPGAGPAQAPPMPPAEDAGDDSDGEEASQLQILLRRKRFKKRSVRRQWD